MEISLHVAILLGSFVLQIVAQNIGSRLYFISNINSLCIDGSPAAYYLNKGYGSGLKSWLIYFEGGGWCYNINQCADRAINGAGSSKNYSKYFDFSTQENYFSLNSNNNVFYNWNTIYLKYCDGGSFTGNSESIFEGKTLHFKGSQILRAFLEVLSNIGGNEAVEMVISGGSAGGLSALLHVDKFKSAFPHSLVVGLPDSGFFLPVNDKACKYNPYESSMKSVYILMNSSQGVHPDCFRANLGFKCMIAFYTLSFLKSPIFAIQSKYDTYEISNIICTNYSDKPKILQLGERFKTEFMESFIIAAKSRPEGRVPHGGFLDSCLHHIYYNQSGNIINYWNILKASNGLSQNNLFRSWYHTIKKIYYAENQTENIENSFHHAHRAAQIYFQNESLLNPFGNC